MTSVTGDSTLILAGKTSRCSNGELKPHARRVGENTTMHKHRGETASVTEVRKLQEGAKVGAAGKISTWGVISGDRVVEEGENDLFLIRERVLALSLLTDEKAGLFSTSIQVLCMC